MDKLSLAELLEVAPEFALVAPEVVAVILAAFSLAEIIDMIAEGINPHDIALEAINANRPDVVAPPPVRVNAPRPVKSTPINPTPPQLPEYIPLGPEHPPLIPFADIWTNTIANARPLYEQKVEMDEILLPIFTNGMCLFWE